MTTQLSMNTLAAHHLTVGEKFRADPRDTYIIAFFCCQLVYLCNVDAVFTLFLPMGDLNVCSELR